MALVGVFNARYFLFPSKISIIDFTIMKASKSRNKYIKESKSNEWTLGQSWGIIMSKEYKKLTWFMWNVKISQAHLEP